MPRGIPKIKKTVAQRLDKWTNKKGRRVSHMSTRCWEWLRPLSGIGGYGQIRINHRAYRAHRVSWIWANKRPIPPGLYILHKCDNRACIRPSHLYAGTQKDNIRDAISRNRHSFGERNGHAKLTEKEVRRIRRAHNAGFKICEIASYYGMNDQSISDIVSHKNWKHIEMEELT